jgi:hypothetical protein
MATVKADWTDVTPQNTSLAEEHTRVATQWSVMNLHDVTRLAAPVGAACMIDVISPGLNTTEMRKSQIRGASVFLFSESYPGTSNGQHYLIRLLRSWATDQIGHAVYCECCCVIPFKEFVRSLFLQENIRSILRWRLRESCDNSCPDFQTIESVPFDWWAIFVPNFERHCYRQWNVGQMCLGSRRLNVRMLELYHALLTPN